MITGSAAREILIATMTARADKLSPSLNIDVTAKELAHQYLKEVEVNVVEMKIDASGVLHHDSGTGAFLIFAERVLTSLEGQK